MKKRYTVDLRPTIFGKCTWWKSIALQLCFHCDPRMSTSVFLNRPYPVSRKTKKKDKSRNGVRVNFYRTEREAKCYMGDLGCVESPLCYAGSYLPRDSFAPPQHGLFSLFSLAVIGHNRPHESPLCRHSLSSTSVNPLTHWQNS